MTVSLRMNPELEARYSSLAASTGRSRSYYLNQALEESIDRLEYEYGLMKQVEDFRAGKLKTYTLDEMIERYDLER